MALSSEHSSAESKSKSRFLQEEDEQRSDDHKVNSEIAVVKTQCSDYRRRCERLETERNHLECERAQHVAEIQSLKRQFAVLSRERETEMEEATEQFNEMIRRYEELAANQTEKKEEEYLELLAIEENKALRFKHALKSEKQKYQNSKEVNKDLQRRINKLEKQLAEGKSNNKKAVLELTEEFSIKEKELNDKIQEMNHSRFMLEEQLAQMSAENRRLCDELNVQHRRSAEATNEIRGLSEYQEKCQSLEEREETLRAQLHEKSHIMTDLRHKIQNLEEELDGKNFELQKQLRLSKLKESQYSQQIQDLEETIVSVRDEQQEHEVTTQQTMEEIKKNQHIIEKKNQEVNTLSNVVSELTEQINSLRVQMESKTHNVSHRVSTPSFYARIHSHSTPKSNNNSTPRSWTTTGTQSNSTKDRETNTSHCSGICKASPVRVNVKINLSDNRNRDISSTDDTDTGMDTVDDSLSDHLETSDNLDSTDYLVSVNRSNKETAYNTSDQGCTNCESTMDQPCIQRRKEDFYEEEAEMARHGDVYNQSIQTSYIDNESVSHDIVIQELRTECEDLRKESEGLQHIIDDLRTDLKQQREVTDQQRIRAIDLKYEMTQKVKSFDAQMSTLRTALNEAEVQITELEETNQGLTEKDDSLKKRLQETQRQLDEATSDYRTNLTSIQTERDTLKSEVLQLSVKAKQFVQLEGEHQKMAAKCQELEPKNKDLNDRLKLALSEKNTFRSQYERALENEKATDLKSQKLEKSVNQLQSLCTVMDTQLQEYEVVNKHLEEEKQHWQEEKNNYEQSINEKETENTSIKHTLNREKAGRQRVEDELSSQRSKTTEMRESMNKDILALRSKLSEEKRNKDHLASQLSNVEQAHQLLKADHKALNYQLKGNLDEGAKLKEELASMKTLNSKLKSLCNALNKDLERALHQGEEVKHQNYQLEDRLDSIQNYYTENRYLMENTLGQHAKLIDYLQTQVENPNKKKKGLFGNKKIDTQIAQGARMRSVFMELEQERERNIHLRQQIAGLRDELHQTRVEATRLQNRLDEGSTIATQVVRPVGSLSTDASGSHFSDAKLPKNIKDTPTVDRKTLKTLTVPPPYQRSALHNEKSSSSPMPEMISEAMHHNIPHRFETGLNSKPAACQVCLGSVQFVKQAAKCQECGMICHPKCAPSMPATCGLPSEYAAHFSSIVSQATALSSSNLASVADLNLEMQGWMKTPRTSKNIWEKKWIVLQDNVLHIYETEDSTKALQSLNLCPPDASVSIHSAVTAAELTNTASSDLPYIIRLEMTPDVSCWPGKSLYLMALTFKSKQKWVATLSAILSHSKPENTKHAKLVSNKIIDASGTHKLDVNCILPINENLALVGADEGLYAMSLRAQSRTKPLLKVSGITSVYQLELIDHLEIIVMITGKGRHLMIVSKDSVMSFLQGHVINKLNLNLTPRGLSKANLTCSVFNWGQTLDGLFLVAALAEKIIIYKYNYTTSSFDSKQDILTSQPCSCVQFGKRQILIGTDKFYSIDLIKFKMTKFVDSHDSTLSFAAFGAAVYESFPIQVLQVSPSGEEEEFLLCFHEFGVFVDCHGKRSRAEDMKWSGLPLSFTYKDPYLYIVYFHHLQVVLLEPSYKDNTIRDKTQVTLPMIRYVGPALTPGAIYVGSVTSERSQVICVKGNMVRSGSESSATDKESVEENKENHHIYAKVNKHKAAHKYSSRDQPECDLDDSDSPQIETYDRSPGSCRTPRKDSSTHSSVITSTPKSTTSFDSDIVKGRVAERAKKFQSQLSSSSNSSTDSKKRYRNATVLQLTNPRN